MTFNADSGGGCESAMMKSSLTCTPDYEAQAARAKKKLVVAENLEEALQEFHRVVGTYAFKEISSFAEMLGGVALVRMLYQRELQELLEQMEKAEKK